MNDSVTPEVPEDLIDTKAAARIARLHISAIRRWIFTGKLPGYRIGRRWLVSRAELMGLWKTSGELAAARGQTPLPSTRRELKARERYVYRRLHEMGIPIGTPAAQGTAR